MRVPRFGGRTSSFLKFLLLLLIVSFVLQTIVEAVVDKDAYYSFFLWTGFTPEGFLSGKLWTLISYACLHEGPWHLVLNLLAVFFMVFLTVFSTALLDDFFWFFFSARVVAFLAVSLRCLFFEADVFLIDVFVTEDFLAVVFVSPESLGAADSSSSSSVSLPAS